MSGHFVLLNISQTDKDEFLARYPRSAWSACQHTDVGWNPDSREVLANAIKGLDIGDREGLPPHCYLDMPLQRESLTPEQRKIIFEMNWTLDLVRPNARGLGLKQLTERADGLFKEGRVREALLEQIVGNGATIEIYHLDRREIT